MLLMILMLLNSLNLKVCHCCNFIFKSSIILIIKDLNILSPHIIKMRKQKSTTINISEVSSSDDESQVKRHKKDFKKYIKDSDESSQEQITPKSSPQNPKVKRKKTPIVQPNKTIPQKISQKNLVQESDLRKLRKKAEILGADSLDYSKRKNYKYVVEYNDKKIHFGSAKTDDYINHPDHVQREKYLNKVKKIKDKDGRLTHKLPFYPNYWSVNLLN